MKLYLWDEIKDALDRPGLERWKSLNTSGWQEQAVEGDTFLTCKAGAHGNGYGRILAFPEGTGMPGVAYVEVFYRNDGPEKMRRGFILRYDIGLMIAPTKYMDMLQLWPLDNTKEAQFFGEEFIAGLRHTGKLSPDLLREMLEAFGGTLALLPLMGLAGMAESACKNPACPIHGKGTPSVPEVERVGPSGFTQEQLKRVVAAIPGMDKLPPGSEVRVVGIGAWQVRTPVQAWLTAMFMEEPRGSHVLNLEVFVPKGTMPGKLSDVRTAVGAFMRSIKAGEQTLASAIIEIGSFTLEAMPPQVEHSVAHMRKTLDEYNASSGGPHLHLSDEFGKKPTYH